MFESITIVLTGLGAYDIHNPMMTNVMETKQGLNAVGARELRNIAEKWVSELLSTGEEVDLRRESRRVFEDSCLEEVLWESFVDEWIDVAYELAGDESTPLDYHDLTDWCVCGDSRADHRLDCQRADCDCERFKRARGEKRPKLRRASKWSMEQHANKRALVEALSARESARLNHLLGGAL